MEMITANHILKLCFRHLSEEWKTIYGEKVEIFIDPLSWREVATVIKKDARSKGSLFEDWIRFTYDSKSETVRAWNAFYASHADILNWDHSPKSWSGCINTRTRESGMLQDVTFRELPDKLRKFLSGLDYIPGWTGGI
jgi:hypothetical protein